MCHKKQGLLLILLLLILLPHYSVQAPTNKKTVRFQPYFKLEKQYKPEPIEKPVEQPVEVVKPQPKENWIPVEVSHYSNKEPGMNAGNNCIGGKLKQGDYALPYEYPVGTKFKIRFPDGHIESGIVMDRGSREYIKTYSRGGKGPVMKIDRFMKDYSVAKLNELGVIHAEVLIEGGK